MLLASERRISGNPVQVCAQNVAHAVSMQPAVSSSLGPSSCPPSRARAKEGFPKFSVSKKDLDTSAIVATMRTWEGNNLILRPRDFHQRPAHELCKAHGCSSAGRAFLGIGKPRHLCRGARVPRGWRRARALVGAWRSFVEHFGMRGTVTDAWEPARSTVDYRGLGRVGSAADKRLRARRPRRLMPMKEVAR